MAVTVLKNIKQAKRGNRAAHLKNSIVYILNPNKTGEGLWVGSNCGVNASEIYNAMIETKQEYGKEWGRQGYQFVISFPPGECDEQTAYKVGREFCEELLKDYDYCFSVHNDHAHMHVHVVFNSVNRISGYKYRYVDGDWERLIQPVTDRLCEKYGLSRLEYEKDGERIGKSYTEHMADKMAKPTGKYIICRDIDYATTHAKDIDDYYRIMKGMGYELRYGHSDKLQKDYIAYHAPGMKRARRDYKLGQGYSLSDIRKRLIDKAYDNDVRAIKRTAEKASHNAILYPDYNLDIAGLHSQSILQVNMLYRISRATTYLRLNLTYEEQGYARRDLLEIDRYREEANYLLDNNIGTREEVENRLAAVRKRLRSAKKEMDRDDIRLQLLMKERRLLMHIERDNKDILNVRPLSYQKAFDTSGHDVQKYSMPPNKKTKSSLVSMEDENLWKN